MLSSGALSALYDEAKVDELENADELTGKDKNKLDNFKKNKPVYDAIVDALNSAVSDKVYENPETFTPVVNDILSGIISDAKFFVKRIKNTIFAHCDLVFLGLNRILEYNASEESRR